MISLLPIRPLTGREFLGFVGAAATVGMLVVINWPGGASRTKVAEQAKPISASRAAYLGFLESYRRTWNQADRERMLEDQRIHQEEWVAPTQWLLSSWQHGCLPEALELVSRWEMESARPLLRQRALDQSPEFARCLQIAEQLSPFPSDEVADLLGSDQPKVRDAALAAFAGRSDLPWSGFANWLAGEDAGLRARTLAALPKELPDPACAMLARVMQFGDEATQVAILGVLGSHRGNAATDALVLSHLTSIEPAVCRAAAEALDALGPEVASTALIQELLTDGRADAELRLSLFGVLQSRDDVDCDRLLEQMIAMETEARYLACRCLLQREDPRGYQHLIDLASEPEVEPALATEMFRLLAFYSGLRVRDPFNHRLWQQNADPREFVGRHLPKTALLSEGRTRVGAPNRLAVPTR